MSRFFNHMSMLTCSSVKVATINVKDKYNMSRFLTSNVNVGHWPSVKVTYDKFNIILL